jgi:sugar lactone lactonase YvrE
MTRIRLTVYPLLAVVAIAGSTPAAAQENPYREASAAFGELPDGRRYGATSAVYPSPDGMTMWVAERCGQNSCVGRESLTTVFQFDLDGKLLKQFGAGEIAWPHGMHVDREGNVWVTDATGIGANIPAGVGHVVLKYSPDGALLMTLGKKGVAGDGPDTFNQPSDVLVAPNGDIFVAEGHSSAATANARVLKFDRTGKLIKEWGKKGTGAGEFDQPHALAMDSQGRLFVGDRGNNRIQIFDQEGQLLDTWYQFSRPSGIFIDQNDVIYVADSESGSVSRARTDWKRGIRIGNAKDGTVTAFIPDPVETPPSTSAAEGVAVDRNGVIYGAEVGPRALKRYVRAGGAR